MANFCSDKKLFFDHTNELGTSVDRSAGRKVFAGPRENLLLTCKLAIFKGNPMEMDPANLQVGLARFSFSLASYCSDWSNDRCDFLDCAATFASRVAQTFSKWLGSHGSM